MRLLLKKNLSRNNILRKHCRILTIEIIKEAILVMRIVMMIATVDMETRIVMTMMKRSRMKTNILIVKRMLMSKRRSIRLKRNLWLRNIKIRNMCKKLWNFSTGRYHNTKVNWIS